MAVSLSYDPQLSRVRIAADGLHPTGTVTVERSTDQVRWSTVRGGTDLAAVNGAVTLDDYEFTADTRNFYRVVPVSPAAGLLLDGVAGNYASTPDHSSLDITGDLDVRVDITHATWRPMSTRNLISKYSTSDNQRSWRLALLSDGRLELRWSTDGASTVAAMSTAAIPANSGQLVVRVELTVSVWSVTFWTGPTVDGPWTQLGSTVTGGPSTAIFAGTAALEVGSISGGTTELIAGVVHRAQVRNGGAGGTLVAQPAFIAQPDGTRSFTDGSGRPWTVNGSARIFNTQTASITPVLDGVWLKSLARPFLNRPVDVRSFSPVTRRSRGGVFNVVGRSRPVAVTELHGSRQWTLELNARTREEADALDLLISTGEVQFVHVPTTGRISGVPGGYVALGDTSAETLPTLDLQWQVISLPLVEVAPPGPDVVPAVGTCQTVLNAYATCADVLESFATCADLLELVGSPGDVIVE